MFERLKDAAAPYLVWIKVGIAVVTLLAAGYAGYSLKGMACALVATTEENAELREAIKAVNEATAERDRIATELAEVLARPKAAPVVERIVNENPSGCVIPRPVGDGLRDAIGKANAAAR